MKKTGSKKTLSIMCCICFASILLALTSLLLSNGAQKTNAESGEKTVGTSLTLSEGIIFNYYARVQTAEAPQAQFTSAALTDETVTGTLVEGETDVWKFSYSKIVPQYLDRTFSVSIGGETCYTGSALDYCNSVLASSPSDMKMSQVEYTATKKLVLDLLGYAKAAAGYTEVDTTIGETAGGTEFATPVSDYVRVSNAEYEGTAYIGGANVIFDYQPAVLFLFVLPDVDSKEYTAQLTFNGTTYDYTEADMAAVGGVANGYSVQYAHIPVSNMPQDFTVVLREDGVEVQTLSGYGIYDYVAAMSDGSSAMATLAKSFYCYGAGAQNYMSALGSDTVSGTITIGGIEYTDVSANRQQASPQNVQLSYADGTFYMALQNDATVGTISSSANLSITGDYTLTIINDGETDGVGVGALSIQNATVSMSLGAEIENSPKSAINSVGLTLENAALQVSGYGYAAYLSGDCALINSTVNATVNGGAFLSFADRNVQITGGEITSNKTALRLGDRLGSLLLDGATVKDVGETEEDVFNVGNMTVRGTTQIEALNNNVIYLNNFTLDEGAHLTIERKDTADGKHSVDKTGIITGSTGEIVINGTYTAKYLWAAIADWNGSSCTVNGSIEAVCCNRVAVIGGETKDFDASVQHGEQSENGFVAPTFAENGYVKHACADCNVELHGAELPRITPENYDLTDHTQTEATFTRKGSATSYTVAAESEKDISISGTNYNTCYGGNFWTDIPNLQLRWDSATSTFVFTVSAGDEVSIGALDIDDSVCMTGGGTIRITASGDAVKLNGSGTTMTLEDITVHFEKTGDLGSSATNTEAGYMVVKNAIVSATNFGYGFYGSNVSLENATLDLHGANIGYWQDVDGKQVSAKGTLTLNSNATVNVCFLMTQNLTIEGGGTLNASAHVEIGNTLTVNGTLAVNNYLTVVSNATLQGSGRVDITCSGDGIRLSGGDLTVGGVVCNVVRPGDTKGSTGVNVQSHVFKVEGGTVSVSNYSYGVGSWDGGHVWLYSGTLTVSDCEKGIYTGGNLYVGSNQTTQDDGRSTNGQYPTLTVESTAGKAIEAYNIYIYESYITINQRSSDNSVHANNYFYLNNDSLNADQSTFVITGTEKQGDGIKCVGYGAIEQNFRLTINWVNTALASDATMYVAYGGSHDWNHDNCNGETWNVSWVESL